MPYAEIQRVTTAQRVAHEWQDGPPPTLDEFLAGGDLAEWRVLHTRCDAVPPDGYSIPVTALNDEQSVIRWTAHLLGKMWLPLTDWAMVTSNAISQPVVRS